MIQNTPKEPSATTAAHAPARAPKTKQGGAPLKSSKGLSWTMINFWLDAAMLVAFLALVWTSTVIRFVFPPTANAEDWSLWSWDVDQWIGLQYVLLCGFTFLVLLHLMFHWSWVCGVIAARLLPRKNGKRAQMDEGVQTIVGVGLMIVLLNIMGFGIAAAVLMIQGPTL